MIRTQRGSRGRARARAGTALAASVVVTLASVVGVVHAGAQSPPSNADVEEAVQKIDGIVAKAMKRFGTPGVAVAVVHDDEVVFTKGYGVRSTETEEPVNKQTVFQIASLSKPVSSTVMAGLVGEGAMAWDDPVSGANPGFALSDPWVSERVTYADLFSMRAGLPGLAGNLLESIGYDRDTILERLRLIELNPFRDSYEYSNFSLTAGGVLAAQAGGMSWEDAAADVLFEPAGMTSTSYRHDDYVASENRADLHVEVDGAWQPDFERMPDPQAPAGGISTNIVDLATWARIILGGGALDDDQLVDADAFAQAVTPSSDMRTPMPPGWYSGGYGLGMIVGTDEHGNQRWNHSGAFSLGAATTAVFLPGLETGIVVLTNAQPVGASEAIADAFMEQVETGSITRNWNKIWGERLTSVYGEPEDIGDAPASPTPPRDNAAYVGTYSNAYVGDFEVAEGSGGELTIIQGPARVTYELTPFDGDTFSYAHSPELPDFLSTVTFTVGPDGQASQIDVSVYDELGWGVLDRV